MLMLETYEMNKLRVLYAEQKKNSYYFDGYMQYHNWNLHLALEKVIDRLEKVIHDRQLFSGKPYEWEGNMITLSVCPDCPLSDKCLEWNQYLEKPKKHYDRYGDEIEYDRAGNRKYQFVNLKTGEMV